MRIGKFLLAMALFAAPALASAQENMQGDMDETVAEIQNQATFCDGTYALCIKAPCVGVPTMDRLGNYTIDHAACSCEVEKGWSMGPGACVDRRPVTQRGRTYLISTYSNSFNKTADKGLKNTLTCDAASTVWAWCYGAPCVVDENDPSRATCNCPLKRGRMSTLGGNCRGEACRQIWSAARPAGDKIANEHYYDYMQKNHPDVSVNPPAQACVPVP